MNANEWDDPETYYSPRTFRCGHCGLNVAASTGFGRREYSQNAKRMIAQGQLVRTPGSKSNDDTLVQLIAICPKCAKPTFWDGDNQIPGSTFGDNVSHLPTDIDALYRESRNCMAVFAYTAGAMACRKILMNIAVAKGAKENQSFKAYVDYLDTKGYVPPDGKAWVNHIRDKGNDANHEIPATSKEDLTDLLTFTQVLLQIIFEFPKRVPQKP
jgi:hypothetical protein